MSVAVLVTQTCQWQTVLHTHVSGGSCYTNASGSSCYTNMSVAVPVTHTSVAVVTQTCQWRFLLLHRRISGGSRYIERSVKVLVSLLLQDLSVAVPVTQTRQWQFLLNSCHKDKAVVNLVT